MRLTHLSSTTEKVVFSLPFFSNVNPYPRESVRDNLFVCSISTNEVLHIFVLLPALLTHY